MLRVCAALSVVLLVPGMASAKELKPKFGDIGGVYYTDVSQNREACRQAIKNKIALCRQNTSFVSNTLDRKYPGCLPLFRQQAGVCADHFRSEAYKCQGAGSARIGDFTGFACTVTATVVEEGGEPERGPDIAPMDRRMKARTRVNLRAGPGTNHRVVGSLAAGQAVRATGRAGDWLRIAAPGGGTAFVHGDFIVASAGQEQQPQDRGPAAGPSPKCAGMGERAKCWREFANRPGCYAFDSLYDPSATVTWSGACADGLAVGRGTWRWKSLGRFGEETGAMVRGKRQGMWGFRPDSGGRDEGLYVNGEKHGKWVFRLANGLCFTTRFSHGKRLVESVKEC